MEGVRGGGRMGGDESIGARGSLRMGGDEGVEWDRGEKGGGE